MKIAKKIPKKKNQKIQAGNVPEENTQRAMKT